MLIYYKVINSADVRSLVVSFRELQVFFFPSNMRKWIVKLT